MDQVGGREGKGRRKGGKFVVVGGVLDQVGGREGKGRKGGKFVGFFFFCVCVGGGGGGHWVLTLQCGTVNFLINTHFDPVLY